MRKLVVITQKVDESDDLLGFFVGWLREFARHFDRVDVIALGAWPAALPQNVRVHSLGKEHGAAKFWWPMRLLWLQARLAPGALAIFCHMSPVFAVAAWPFARFARAKLILWYLHRSVTLRLRLALAMSDQLVTADASSLRIRSPKIISVGHGIDAARFQGSGRTGVSGRPLRVIGVGRLAPIKDFGTLIHAAALLKQRGARIEVRIVGRAYSGHQEEEQGLRALAAELGLVREVAFVGFIPYPQMSAQYAWADIAYGGTPPGGLDKAILEGMAAGCIPFTSNDAMRPYLVPYADRLLYVHGNPDDLALRLSVFNASEPVSKAMVSSIRRHHDLGRTIGRISELMK